MAPQEVIRAAYKALSQKYHPDKNPGDEKAARIMAILNSAYGTLSDPQRRREHDEWIAAEEWEIEWLESTKSEEESKKDEQYSPQWVPESNKASKLKRGVRMSLLVALCISLGWGAAALMQWQFQIIPYSAANGFGTKNTLVSAAPTPTPAPLAKPQEIKPVENKVSLVTQVLLTGLENHCQAPLRPETAPNGENWPAKSAYLEGYKVANGGADAKIVLDNSANQSDAMVRIFDRDKLQAVRFVFVRGQEKFTVENLHAGNYEVQQQALGPNQAAKAACEAEVSLEKTPARAP